MFLPHQQQAAAVREEVAAVVEAGRHDARHGLREQAEVRVHARQSGVAVRVVHVERLEVGARAQCAPVALEDGAWERGVSTGFKSIS